MCSKDGDPHYTQTQLRWGVSLEQSKLFKGKCHVEGEEYVAIPITLKAEEGSFQSTARG